MKYKIDLIVDFEYNYPSEEVGRMVETALELLLIKVMIGQVVKLEDNNERQETHPQTKEA